MSAIQMDGPDSNHRRRPHDRDRYARYSSSGSHKSPLQCMQTPSRQSGSTQGYAFSSTIMPLLLGKVADVHGRVKLYNVGFIVFTVGSLMTSFSQGPDQIIAFRTLQGVGAALMWSNSIAMITDATPRKELGFSMAINSIAFNVGSVSGLVISGLILAFLDWRYLFYINVPIGVIAIIWSYLRLHEVGKREERAPIDWGGFLTFSASLTSLLLALTYAAYGGSGLSEVFALLLMSGASMVAFVLHERRSDHPLLDLRILRITAFSGHLFSLTMNLIAVSSVSLLLSLYFQLALGLSPLEAGIRLIPMDLAMFIFAPFSGKLSDRFGNVPFMVGAVLLQSASMLFLSSVDFTTSYGVVAVYSILYGAAFSMFVAPSTSWGMGPVPPGTRGVAASLRSTLWNLGLAVSLNLAVLIMTFIVPFGTLSAVISSGNTGFVSLADRTLFLGGIRASYLWLGLLNLCTLIPIAWATRKSRTKSRGEPAHLSFAASPDS